MSRELIPVVAISLALVGIACTATRVIAPVPTPEAIDSYLRTHPRDALRVTDSAGRARWFYSPTLSPDTLRGFRAATMPRLPIAIPVGQITSIAAPKFSASRTLGLIGAAAALGALFVLTAPRPIY